MRKVIWITAAAFLVVIIIVAVSSSDAGDRQQISPNSQPTASNDSVTYTVEGKSKASNVSYSIGIGNISQANDVKLPWKKDVPDEGFFSLTAQNAGSGTITCRIKRGDEVIAENSSSGKYAVVSCSGS